jgi:hypothetical protein
MGTVVRELPAGGLPPQLPLVPLYEAVVLPLGFLRVRIPDSAVAEVELVQHLAASFLRSKQSLRQRKDSPPPLVAAVPVVSSRVVGAWEPVRGNWTPDDARVSTTTPGRDKTDDTASGGALVQHGVESNEGDQTLFPVGTVAAVLQVLGFLPLPILTRSEPSRVLPFIDVADDLFCKLPYGDSTVAVWPLNTSHGDPSHTSTIVWVPSSALPYALTVLRSQLPRGVPDVCI